MLDKYESLRPSNKDYFMLELRMEPMAPSDADSDAGDPRQRLLDEFREAFNDPLLRGSPGHLTSYVSPQWWLPKPSKVAKSAAKPSTEPFTANALYFCYIGGAPETYVNHTLNQVRAPLSLFSVGSLAS